MKIDWKISPLDKKRVKKFYNLQKDEDFVVDRKKNNVDRETVYISKEKVWKVLVGCLLTTQQRSGPDSNVSKLLRTNPFPLSYKACRSQDNVEKFSYQTLSAFKGIRRTNRIALEIATNLTHLEEGLWIDTLAKLKKLQKGTTSDLEREVADYIAKKFHGLGPKQSRNFLQWLGLSRYEIPIDSRITKWLNKFGFPVVLSATALSDINYYHFVSDGIQKLCLACDIEPCLLDAAIFTSYDGET